MVNLILILKSFSVNDFDFDLKSFTKWSYPSLGICTIYYSSKIVYYAPPP